MDNEEQKKGNTEFYIQMAAILILGILLIYGLGKASPTGGVIGVVSASEIIPTGVPEVYGKELGIKYDDVSASNPQLADATMAKLTKYEDMQLNSAQMERYVKIGSSIACEYCCGAKTLVFSNGEKACGCAHSYAMRGLAKYLLTKHPEMTDLEILEELGKWKVLFFPGVHEQKATILKSQGIELSYINLASNKYR